MKSFIIIFIFFNICLSAKGQVTYNVNAAGDYTHEICPGVDVILKFNFTYPLSNTISSTNGLKGITIVSNIQSNNTAIVRFSDKKEPHEFKVYDIAWHTTTNPFVFKRIKTLDGIRPEWPAPVPSWITPFPLGPNPTYNDVLNSASPATACATTSFTYSGPDLKYKDANGNAFGTFPMHQYEWLPPKGWKINGTICDGTNPIGTTSPTATIVPDPLTGGEIRMRAKNDCDQVNLKKSDWYRILLSGRPPLTLSVNGVNPITIACEDQATRTFTIANTLPYTCITSYIWTVGANWLLPNGTPAPSTITTTTPSLALKPVGNAAPGVISVKFNINGTLNANTQLSCSTLFINNPPPSFSISGENAICSGQKSFFVVSSNTNTTWNLNSQPAGIVTYSINGNNIVISRVPNMSGILTLTSTIQNACGAQRISAPKTISIGTPNTPSLYAFWDNTVKIRVIAAEVPGARYRWFINDVFVAETSDYNTSIPSRIGYYPDGCTRTFDVGLDLVTSCGTSTVLQRKYYYLGMPPCDGSGGGHRKSSDTSSEANSKDTSNNKPINDKLVNAEYKISIAPNPVATNLNISVYRNILPPIDNVDNGQAPNIIKEIILLDQIGVIKKRIKCGEGVKNVNMNVQEFIPGIYFLRIFDGEKWTNHKLLIGR
ncbi:hypothetical protein [Agriterribacter humi]|uniref:hypothetical protein n=1 Tax=Agriterribacter humi TaxID=1104781 RepID=UPI001265668E|nr:hypothetical protein [Agriterribacter humi]